MRGSRSVSESGENHRQPATGGLPGLSVVVGAPAGWRTCRRAVRHLQAQTSRRELELILVLPDPPGLTEAEPAMLSGFHSLRVVDCASETDVARAVALGLAASRAPVVAIVENHAYPDPGWAEALIRAHQARWTGIGSRMTNANPERAVSWANFWIAYGRFAGSAGFGECDEIPVHNGSFKRACLEGIAPEDLPGLLGRGQGLIERLRERGARFYLEREATIAHLNPATVGATARLRFDAARLYGARAARQTWTLGRRVLLLTLFPLIPAANLVRAKRRLRGMSERPSLSRLAALAFCYILEGLGMAWGHLLGPGNAEARLANFETDRLRYLPASDRLRFER